MQTCREEQHREESGLYLRWASAVLLIFLSYLISLVSSLAKVASIVFVFVFSHKPAEFTHQPEDNTCVCTSTLILTIL